MVSLVAVLRDAIALRKEALRRVSIQRLLDDAGENVHLIDRTSDGAVVEIITRGQVHDSGRDGVSS